MEGIPQDFITKDNGLHYQQVTGESPKFPAVPAGWVTCAGFSRWTNSASDAKRRGRTKTRVGDIDHEKEKGRTI